MSDADTFGAGDTAPAPTTAAEVNARRAEQRRQESMACRQCIVAMVDYAASIPPPHRTTQHISEISERVVKRAGAAAAARAFLRLIEADVE